MTKKDRSRIQNYEKCIFLGYGDRIKGYRLWNPTIHKFVITRDVIVADKTLQMEEKENDNTLNKKAETMMENGQDHEDSNSSEGALEHEVQEQVESDASKFLRTTRERRLLA